MGHEGTFDRPSRAVHPGRLLSTELATVTVVLHGRASTVQVDPVGAPLRDAVVAGAAHLTRPDYPP